MTPPARRKLLLATTCVLVVLVARTSLSLAILHDGFRALSDDDYSRIVIAQQFAAHPSIDPSKTSWLPFPFWLYGTLMAGLGSSLAVARGLGFALGLASSSLLWLAARWLGLSRVASVIGVLIGMTIPYAAWLGLAATPDYYTATLIIVSCASLTRKRFCLRAFGAAALIAACLSRYEAWPVALLWAFLTGRDALRLRAVRFAGIALAVLAAPLFWILHGWQLHDDPLFFVARVTSYQHALGPVERSVLARCIRTPWRLIADAPELIAYLLIVIVASQLRGVSLWRQRWSRPFWCLLALVVFLCIGDCNGSTATHHTGRTLLVVWDLVAFISAAGLVTLVNTAAARVGPRLLAGALVCTLMVAALMRARPARAPSLQARFEEVEMGLLAAGRVPRGERLLIDTPDFGYFAVQAAYARPLQSIVLDTHDPRSQHDNGAGWGSANRPMRVHLSARWIVASRAHEHWLPPNATVYRRGRSLFFAQLR